MTVDPPRPPTTGETLTLQEAADRLGVHYQTAYRLVRTGALPAVRVGRSYRIASSDVDAVAAERRTPSPPPRRRPRGGPDALADRAFEALIEGDEDALLRTATGLLETGWTITEFIDTGLAPAIRRIGDAWHAGELDVHVEHRATAIAERLVSARMPRPSGRRRGTAVVASLEGDRHSLATSLAAVALRDDRWHVQHLGADLPPSELAAFVEEEAPDLVVITVVDPSGAVAADAFAADHADGETRVLVGAPGTSLARLQRLARDGNNRD